MKTYSLIFALVLLSGAAFGTTCKGAAAGSKVCYVSFTDGNDANTGDDTAHSIKYLPGMFGSTSSIVPGATASSADQFILKSGDTWPNAAFLMNWTWAGNVNHFITITGGGGYSSGGCTTGGVSGTGPVNYTGAAAFTGGCAIFDFGGLACGNGSVSNQCIKVNNKYVQFQNIEMKNYLWTAGGSAVATVNNTTQGNIWKNIYFHAWSHTGTGEVRAFFIWPTGSTAVGGVADTIVVDGYDSADVVANLAAGRSAWIGSTAALAMSGSAIFGGSSIAGDNFTVKNNVARYTGAGLFVGSSPNVFGNLCEYSGNDIFSGVHANCIEINLTPVGSTTYVYNNINRHIPSSQTVLFFIDCYTGTDCYVYNNLQYDIPAANILNLGSPAFPNSFGNYHVLNNTFECGYDPASPISAVNPLGICVPMTGAQTGVPTVEFRNNHFITNSGTFIGTNAAISSNITGSITTATGGGATTTTLTRAAGSFVTDGYVAGNNVRVTGFANATNNQSFAIATSGVSALTLTLKVPSGYSTIAETSVVGVTVAQGTTITTSNELHQTLAQANADTGLYTYANLFFPQATGGSTIDAGATTAFAYDFLNVSRPQRLSQDIGAYELTGPPNTLIVACDAAGTGTCSITSDDTFINGACTAGVGSGTLTHGYASGTPTLTATATSGSFTNWSGDASCNGSTSPACSLNMNQARTVTASCFITPTISLASDTSYCNPVNGCTPTLTATAGNCNTPGCVWECQDYAGSIITDTLTGFPAFCAYGSTVNALCGDGTHPSGVFSIHWKISDFSFNPYQTAQCTVFIPPNVGSQSAVSTIGFGAYIAPGKSWLQY